MCFAGDSLDLQWSEILGHQLHRAAFLASSPISSVRETNSDLSKLGCNLHVPMWWGMMKEINQYDALDRDGEMLARFRYFKLYQLVPGYLEFIRKNCDILIINLSMHWKPSDGKGDDPKSYFPLAVEAAGVYLSNFSNNGKIAIWRETQPQHFPSQTGLWEGKPVLPCQERMNKTGKGVYNAITLAMFQRLSESAAPLSEKDAGNATATPAGKRLHQAFRDWTRPGGGPDPLLYTLHANQDAGYLESLRHYWQTENDKDGSKYAGELADLKSNPKQTSGKVYWWPIFDIFDRFYDWHHSDQDCTHFCFTIGPFDAGLERLGLIIADAVSARAGAVVPDPAPDRLVC